MIEPQIETLLEHVDSKYTLVILAAKRSRQINSLLHPARRGSIRIHAAAGAAGCSRAPKTLSIALQEIAEGKVEYERTMEGIK